MFYYDNMYLENWLYYRLEIIFLDHHLKVSRSQTSKSFVQKWLLAYLASLDSL